MFSPSDVDRRPSYAEPRRIRVKNAPKSKSNSLSSYASPSSYIGPNGFSDSEMHGSDLDIIHTTEQSNHEPSISHSREPTAQVPRIDFFDEHGFVISDFSQEPVAKNSGKKYLRKLMQRQQKWIHMLYGTGGTVDKNINDPEARLHHWNNKILKHRKLKSRIRKGVPNILRGEVWIHITSVRKFRVQNPTVYSSFLESGRENPHEKQIWKDIDRTYRNHQSFKESESALQVSLYNVLYAYSLYNPKVGYNQAMSFVAALCLFYMEEEDVFWMLHTLALHPKFQMAGLWSERMPLVPLRFHQMEQLVDRYLPKLSRMFSTAGVLPGMYQATQWFLTIFLATDISFDIQLRIMDIYLNEGTKFVFRFGLAILETIESQCLNCADENDVFSKLAQASRYVTEETIERALHFPIKHNHLKHIEERYVTEG